MLSTNLLRTKPTDISIYCNELSDDIFKDFRFIDLMNTIIQEEYLYKYKFAIYTDLNGLRTNLFVPIFHTMYLGSSNHNVIITDDNDLWLLDTFSNNKYFIMPKSDDTFNYNPYNITKIQNIKELIHYEILQPK